MLRRRAGDHRSTLTAEVFKTLTWGRGPRIGADGGALLTCGRSRRRWGSSRGADAGGAHVEDADVGAGLRDDPEQWGVAHDLKTQTQELTKTQRLGRASTGGRKTRGTEHAHVLKTKMTRVAVAATTQNTGTVSPFS